MPSLAFNDFARPPDTTHFVLFEGVKVDRSLNIRWEYVRVGFCHQIRKPSPACGGRFGWGLLITTSIKKNLKERVEMFFTASFLPVKTFRLMPLRHYQALPANRSAIPP